MTRVIIIEQSYLIRLALRDLIQSVDNTVEIADYEFLSFDEMKKIPSSDHLVVLINPDQIKTNGFDRLRNKKIKTIKLTHSLSNKVKDDDFVYINDKRETIIQKIEPVLNEFNKNRGNNKVISKRESDILKYVALGLTNKEIADKLFISTHTVITHRKNISAKLGIKTIAGFTVYALLNKILLPEEVVNDSMTK